MAVRPRSLHHWKLWLIAFPLATIYSFARSEPEAPQGLEDWAFLLGDWNVVESRFDFDGGLMQENRGRASFSSVLEGQRFQETQSIPRGDEPTAALHVFVFDPRSEQIEIARTDSGHFGFSILIGSLEADTIRLKEKHPNPDHDVRRRVTYTRQGSDQFQRVLEFSTDEGESWFVRSRWEYRRA